MSHLSPTLWVLLQTQLFLCALALVHTKTDFWVTETGAQDADFWETLLYLYTGKWGFWLVLFV